MTLFKLSLRELLSLWERFSSAENPETVQFERGHTPWKNVFTHLYAVRFWNASDRLRETGLIEEWEQWAHDPLFGEATRVTIELEIWFKDSEADRAQAEMAVETALRELRDTIIVNRCIIEEIRYHALLVELPISAVEQIINENARVIQCDEIMYVRASGQIAFGISPLQEATLPEPPLELPTGEPIVALLDGVPVQNHAWLRNRLSVSDPDGYAATTPQSARHHGTAMASLIVHGEIDSREAPLPRPLVVRPLMASTPEGSSEAVPPNRLLVDLVHIAIHQLIAGTEEEPPIAPTVRIINFSIAYHNRQFVRIPCPLAKLLDWLAYEYDLLFFVSAGNHSLPVEVDCTYDQLPNLLEQPQELRKLLFTALDRDRRNRRLLQPSESINALTVGALHCDSSGVPIPEQGLLNNRAFEAESPTKRAS